MCGIAGQVTADRRPVDHARISAMGERLRHRGPDDQGVYVNGHVGLAHRRLSVIDLSPAGRQPMSNEVGNVWITFNGEIYNFKELRKALESRHEFRSRTDTEVILHLYEEYGLQCLPMLRGMFAFAIWDEAAQRLVLARDRLGKKPLYYWVKDQSLAFASELKALFVDGCTPEIDPVAIHHYLTFQYVPTPMTGFREVRKLQPGHVLVYEDGKISEHAYWSLRYREKLVCNSDEEYREAFRSLLKESVQLRLESEVPLGAFLSGGLDSSSVVALMCQEATQPVMTFSMGFKDDAFNELPYAREIAERLHTDHHEFVVEPSAVEILPALVRVYDEPYADSSAIPTYYLSRFSRERVTVVLNGDGGDELLGGYPRYRFGALHSLLMRAIELRQGTQAVTGRVADWLTGLLPSSNGIRAADSRLARLLQPLSWQYLNRVSYFTPAQKEWLYTPEFNDTLRAHHSRDVMARWFDEAQAITQLDRLLSVDTRSYLLDDLLVKVDRATMAHGLEARSPFLDHKVVEFAAALPIRQKVRNGETKYILREAMRGTLPDPVLTREKKGFAVPIDRWFREECRDLLWESLLSTRATERGYFQPGHIQTLIREHEQDTVSHGARLYALLMLELWHREYVDTRTCVV